MEIFAATVVMRHMRACIAPTAIEVHGDRPETESTVQLVAGKSPITIALDDEFDGKLPRNRKLPNPSRCRAPWD
jgi:hypothetical protein